LTFAGCRVSLFVVWWGYPKEEEGGEKEKGTDVLPFERSTGLASKQ
jgi:hypothetical protein